MEQALVDLVWLRAHSCCEYCHLPHGRVVLLFEIDHIIAKKHGGETVAEPQIWRGSILARVGFGRAM